MRTTTNPLHQCEVQPVISPHILVQQTYSHIDNQTRTVWGSLVSRTHGLAPLTVTRRLGKHR